MWNNDFNDCCGFNTFNNVDNFNNFDNFDNDDNFNNFNSFNNGFRSQGCGSNRNGNSRCNGSNRRSCQCFNSGFERGFRQANCINRCNNSCSF